MLLGEVKVLLVLQNLIQVVVNKLHHYENPGCVIQSYPVRRGHHYVDQLGHIDVVIKAGELPQKTDFPIDIPEGNKVIEVCLNELDRNGLLKLPVLGSDHLAKRPLSEDFEQLVLLLHHGELLL